MWISPSGAGCLRGMRDGEKRASPTVRARLSFPMTRPCPSALSTGRPWGRWTCRSPSRRHGFDLGRSGPGARRAPGDQAGGRRGHAIGTDGRWPAPGSVVRQMVTDFCRARWERPFARRSDSAPGTTAWQQPARRMAKFRERFVELVLRVSALFGSRADRSHLIWVGPFSGLSLSDRRTRTSTFSAARPIPDRLPRILTGACIAARSYSCAGVLVHISE